MYYSEVRALCKQVTGRDNRAAHRRYSELIHSCDAESSQLWDDIENFFVWVEEFEDKPEPYGFAWDELMRLNATDKKGWWTHYINGVEYVIGASW